MFAVYLKHGELTMWYYDVNTVFFSLQIQYVYCNLTFTRILFANFVVDQKYCSVLIVFPIVRFKNTVVSSSFTIVYYS